MGQAVLIRAVDRGDAENEPGPAYTISIQAVLDDNLYLQRRDFLGATFEPEFPKWPFILEAPRTAERMGRLVWGVSKDPEYAIGEPDGINIYDKRIAIDEFFTRWHEGEEWTYRITNVQDLTTLESTS